MPIKPENRALYPKDWPQISREAKERAGWRCQHCGPDGKRCTAMQYAVGHWELRGQRGAAPGVWMWQPTCGNGPHDAAGQGLEWPSGQRLTYSEARQFAADASWGCPDDPPQIVIVLTVAHLNHQPEDCRPENLAAMCQRHHLAYDHDHHRANAQATRRARSGTLELF